MSDRPHKATFTIRCHDAADAHALRSALQVEVEDAAGGTVVQIDGARSDQASFTVHIEARLVGNLRAASRTSLQCLMAASGALDASAAAEGP